MTPTWEQRRSLRAWYSSMWTGVGVFWVWAVWDAGAATLWWPLGWSVAATVPAWVLGYALRVMDPVSWAVSRTAFIAR